MLYKFVEEQLAAGRIKVLLPADGRGNEVYFDCSMLTSIAICFLSRAENQRIAKLSLEAVSLANDPLQ